MENFTSGFFAYISGIDWGYIVPFLLITFLANKWIDAKDTRICAVFRTRYRVFLIGTVYAGIVFYLRGYSTRAQSEQLLQAYLFGVVFYSLVIDIPAAWLEVWVRNTVKAKLTNGTTNESV